MKFLYDDETIYSFTNLSNLLLWIPLIYLSINFNMKMSGFLIFSIFYFCSFFIEYFYISYIRRGAEGYRTFYKRLKKSNFIGETYCLTFVVITITKDIIKAESKIQMLWSFIVMISILFFLFIISNIIKRFFLKFSKPTREIDIIGYIVMVIIYILYLLNIKSIADINYKLIMNQIIFIFFGTNITLTFIKYIYFEYSENILLKKTKNSKETVNSKSCNIFIGIFVSFLCGIILFYIYLKLNISIGIAGIIVIIFSFDRLSTKLEISDRMKNLIRILSK